MRLVSVPIVALATLTLYVGLSHLLVYARRRDSSRQDLYFAISACLLAIYDALSVGLYESNGVDEGATYQLLQIPVVALVVVPFARFIESFTGVRPPRAIRAIAWVFPLFALVGFLIGGRALLTGEPAIKHVDAPFFGEVVYYEQELGPLGVAIMIAAPYLAATVIWSGFELRASGRSQRAQWFVFAASVFVASAMNDAMISLGVYRSVYLLEYGWTGVILLMSFSVSDEIAQVARARAEVLESRVRTANAERLESVGKLAGAIAHDLNNMLTPVLSYAELVRRKLREDSKERDFLTEVIAGTERAAVLTRQLLAYGRRQTLEVRSVDLDEALREFLPLLRRLVPESIRLNAHVEPDVPKVVADRGQLEQVFMNLVTNAVDAMPDGGEIAIEIRADVDRHTSGSVLIEVRDDGAGMDDDTLRRVFEPFFTTRPRGTRKGLGLSIVDGIVSQHGGAVAVTSALGRGTKVVIRLPARDATESTEISHTRLHVMSARGDERILVVEDDESVRRLIDTVLSETGFRVSCAGSASEVRALLATSQAPFDLLVSDVILDDSTGPEILSLVEASQGRIPCLFVSGYSSEVLAPKGVLARGMTLLRKPFTPDDLVAYVRRVAERGKSESASDELRAG